MLFGKKKENTDKVDDYFALNRRELIDHYFQGSNRLTWRLRGDDKKIGKWAACFIAAATAIRGANFRGLVHGIPEQAQDAIEHYEKLKSLCNGVVSGSDNINLKAYEPDILGETFFLRFLEDCPDLEKHLPDLMVAGAGRINEQSAVEFVAFITRLARNLSNDDQNSTTTIQAWEQLIELLQAQSFSNHSPFQWAVALACFEIYRLLDEKTHIDQANKFFELVNADNLYLPPASALKARHVLQAIHYFSLQQKAETQLVSASLKQLLSVWDNGEARDYTGLMLALWAKNTPIARYLMQQGGDFAKVAKEGWTALMFACRYDQPKVALALVEKEANLNAENSEGWTALILACQHDQPEVALALVEKEANLNAENNEAGTALMLACRYDQPEVALALVEKEANLKAENNEAGTALMLACRYDQPEVALALVEKEANLEAQTDGGWTALMLACRYDQPEVALALVEKEANLNAENNEAGTALMLACRYDQPEVALALVKKEANLKAENNEVGTALILACRYSQPEVALALVKKEANLEAQGDDGKTALIGAVLTNQKEVVQLLIKKHVDTDAYMELEGIKITALGLARDAGHHDLIKMLEAKGALELPPRMSKE